jgi:methionyl-tRNA formyltransferase
MSLRYVFFGTPESCVTALDILIGAGRTPVALVCQPDRPSGRGRKVAPPPTKEWACRQSVSVLQPAKCRESDFLSCVRDVDADVGLVFAFGQLLPEELLTIPRLGFINIHPSLLPRYRGAAPVQWTLINGDQATGVSIVKVTPRLDDGDIILQESTEVDLYENAVELGQRLALMGGKLAVQALERLEAGDCDASPQDEGRVVWARALTKQDGRIDWAAPTISIHNRIRGVQPWPGASTTLGGKVLKIHRAVPVEGKFPEAQPGQVVAAVGEDLRVRSGDGILKLLEVQLEGKKKMDARAFLLGRSLGKGEVLV